MKLKLIGILSAILMIVGALIQPASAIQPGPAAPAATADLTVTAVEVSQGMQDLGNNMPVISKRRTIIRGYVQNLPGSNVAGITARAKVYKITNGQAALLGTLKPGKSTITVLGNGGRRTNLNDSFWFYLHKDWAVGQVRIDVEVNHNGAVADSNQGNDLRSATVNFKNANALNLLMMPMHVHGNGGTYYCGPTCEKMYLNVIRYHPISTLKMWYSNDALKPVAHLVDEWYPASTKKDRSKMLDRLAWARTWRNDPASNMYYYGMLHPDHGAFGIGRMDNYVAMGTMNNTISSSSPWSITGGSIMAHELGHNKNLKHVNCNNTEAEGGEVDPNYPWPFPNCRLSTVSASGYYGLDVYYDVFGLAAPTVISNDPAMATPQRGFPMMGYQNPGYISPWEYCKLMPKYGVPCAWPPNAADQADQAISAPATDPLAASAPIPAAAQPAVNALRSADDFAMISGIIDDTDGTVELNPFYVRTVVTPGLLQETIERRIAEASSAPAASHQHADGSLHQHAAAVNDWKIAVLDAAGTTFYSHTVAFGETAHDGAAITAITDLIPLPAGSKTIRITRNGMTMAQRTRTANAPIVELDEPAAGALEAGDVLTWQARDLDGDPLVHTVLYSPDGGQAWYPLELDTPTTALTLTEEMLRSVPGGSSVQLKVVTSDGLNSGEDTTTGALTAANNAPAATITSPEPAMRATPGEPVVLGAETTDWEDGEVAEASIAWASDRDGPLGTGSEIVTDSLSTGKHTITLTVTDSGGAQATATVEINVTSPYVYLPMIQR